MDPNILAQNVRYRYGIRCDQVRAPGAFSVERLMQWLKSRLEQILVSE
jgi:hypothetical protein